MGPCGNGKSSFVNLICGSNLPTGQSSHSLTRFVTEMRSQINYQNPFIIYDTPGTTAHVDKLQHSVHLRQLLQYKPINAVLILIKFVGRYDDIIRDIFKQTKILSGYDKSILFLISHFDHAINPQQAMSEIDKMLNEIKIKNQIIYYSSINVDRKQLSDSTYKICASYPRITIKIEDKTFLKHFNLHKDEMQELYFKQSQKDALQQMDKITDMYINCAKQLPKNHQRDAIFQDLDLSLKNQLKDILQQFVQKYKTTMVTMQYYTSYYTLQLKINEHLNNFQQKIRSLQSHFFIQHTASGDSNKLDIRDLIKRCPNCNQIWMRIQACPNTICGKRPSCVFDFMRNAVFKYKIVRDKKSKKINIVKADTLINSNKNALNNGTLIGDKKMQQRLKMKNIGCGQALNFEILPRLPNIEQVLKEWYNVHTFQEVMVQFQKDQDLQKTRKRLQQQVKGSFQSFSY